MRRKTTAVYGNAEFARESERLASLVWDAMGIAAGERVLFCGYGPDAAIIARAVAEGAAVTVIESRDEIMKRNEGLEVKVLRGSTSAIPAKNSAFDLAIANSYLHEIDPLFHGNVVNELGRTALRVVIVEPMPPNDELSKRIATLYSRAKRELGQFEYYQAPSYWRKLLSMAKATVAEAVFEFAKAPPREYLVDTLELLLETMRVEDAPQYYIDQLREIARHPGAQLLPQGRLVLVGLPEKGSALPSKSIAAMLSVGSRNAPGTAGTALGSPLEPEAKPAPGSGPVETTSAPPPSVAAPPATPAAAPQPPLPQPPPPEPPSFGLPRDEGEPFGVRPGFDQPPAGWHWEPPEDAGS